MFSRSKPPPPPSMPMPIPPKVRREQNSEPAPEPLRRMPLIREILAKRTRDLSVLSNSRDSASERPSKLARTANKPEDGGARWSALVRAMHAALLKDLSSPIKSFVECKGIIAQFQSVSEIPHSAIGGLISAGFFTEACAYLEKCRSGTVVKALLCCLLRLTSRINAIHMDSCSELLDTLRHLSGLKSKIATDNFRRIVSLLGALSRRAHSATSSRPGTAAPHDLGTKSKIDIAKHEIKAMLKPLYPRKISREQYKCIMRAGVKTVLKDPTGFVFRYIFGQRGNDDCRLDMESRARLRWCTNQFITFLQVKGPYKAARAELDRTKQAYFDFYVGLKGVQ